MLTDNGFDANYGENPSDAFFCGKKKVQPHVSGHQFEGILGCDIFLVHCQCIQENFGNGGF